MLGKGKNRDMSDIITIEADDKEALVLQLTRDRRDPVH